MGKRDDLIAKYADDLKNKCKIQGDKRRAVGRGLPSGEQRGEEGGEQDGAVRAGHGARSSTVCASALARQVC